MGPARKHEISEKQFFCTKCHEIVIFVYYSKKKYCLEVDFTYTHQNAYKLVHWLQSYCPLMVLITRRDMSVAST